jgi:hypothetical protein
VRKLRNIFSRQHSAGEAPAGEELSPAAEGATPDAAQDAPARATEAHRRGTGSPPLLARRPTKRVTAALAAAMLAVGVGVGAAIGPAPTATFAGDTPALIAHLLSELAAARPHSTPPAPAVNETPAETAATGTASKASAASAVPASSPPAQTQSTTPASQEAPSEPTKPATSKVPAITSVWLIELSGTSFQELLAQKSAAPYITGALIPAGTLLEGWSALQGSALAGEAGLAAPTSAAGTPPLLHSIVQPPCPEGAAGGSCSTTAGAIATADEFAKATLPAITSSSAYKEHGLVVLTLASVGIASQQGLPAGTSSATLTSQPPGGVLLLSPFAKAGRSNVSFSASAPVTTVEQLLR